MFWKRHAYMSAAGAGSGGGGGGAGAGAGAGGGAGGGAGATGGGSSGGDAAGGAKGAADGKAAAGTGGGDELASLRAQLAELQAKAAKRDADEAAAKDAAKKAEADKAEAERQSKLTAQQKIDEELGKQRSEIEATKAELVGERRALALERMGVLPNFRDYAPKVDPKTADGAAALEKWAKEHPQAIASSVTSAAPPVKPVGALAEIVAGTKKNPLLSSATAERLLAKLGG